MKQLEAITTDNVDFDDAVLEVTNRFNELLRANKTVQYKDIHIARGLFGRFWIVLLYEYDMSDPYQEFDNGNIVITGLKATHIGMMPGLDPNDPNWREKQALWEASRNAQEARTDTITEES